MTSLQASWQPLSFVVFDLDQTFGLALVLQRVVVHAGVEHRREDATELRERGALAVAQQRLQRVAEFHLADARLARGLLRIALGVDRAAAGAGDDDRLRRRAATRGLAERH